MISFGLGFYLSYLNFLRTYYTLSSYVKFTNKIHLKYVSHLLARKLHTQLITCKLARMFMALT